MKCGVWLVQTLMEDQERDAYNRFGVDGVAFDPRKDELKLLSNIAYKYVAWFVLLYALTLPPAARSSRTWDIFLGIGARIVYDLRIR